MDTTGAQSNGANPNFSGTTADGSYAAGGGQAASSPGQQVTLQNGGVNQFGGTQLNPSSPLPEVPQTQDASAISQGTQPIQFPSNQPDTGVTASNANSANTSIPNPATIINQETQQTPAEQTNNSLLTRLAGIMQGKSSLATLQTQQEATAGVPAMTKTLNDLNTQLQGLNDQSSALALNAGPGGTIQNQEQNQAQGRGVTTQGLAPLSAGDLRNNQIQQAAVAAQALTLKSAVYAAQGNLTLAKDAADKAGQVQFDAETQQIDYMNSLIAANKPQMTKEEKAQADTVTQQLADRTQAIANAKADKVTAVGLATAAMKNNPNDPQAQQAAQQALALNPDDPNYLNKVADLVAKYQTDPITVQKSLVDLQNARLTGVKTQQDIAINQQTLNGGGSIPVMDNQGNQVNVPANVAPYYNTSNSGVGYADLSTVQGTTAQKAAAVRQAQAAGIKVITNKNTALDLTNIGDANSKLDSIAQIMSGIDQPGALSRFLYGAGMTKFAEMSQSNPQQAAAGALQGVGLDILKAISGVQGFRGNTTVVQQINEHLPSIYDTNAVVQQKVGYIRQLLNDRENAILGVKGNNTTNTQNTQNMTTKSGKAFDYAGAVKAGYTDQQIQQYIAAN